MAEVENAVAEEVAVEVAEYSKEETQEYIRRINEENKSYRQNKATLTDEAKAGTEALAKLKSIEEAQLIDDGKLKELLASKDDELESLKGMKLENEQYQEIFKAQYEEVSTDLPENLRNIVENSGKSIAGKLEMSKTLIAEFGVKSNESPASERGGSYQTTQSDDTIIADFKNEKNGIKKMEKLQEIKSKLPHLYKQLLNKG